MSQPGVDAHVDQILTNMSIAYMQSADKFIADKVFPRIPVTKQSDKYFVFTKDDWFRDEAKVRGDNEESVGSGYNLSTDTYYANVYAFHKDVGKQTKANTDRPLDWRRNATQFVTQRLLLRREIEFANKAMKTGVWATDRTGGASGSGGDFVHWSDYEKSNPIEDIEAGKETILSVTGHEANTLVVGYQVFRQLKHHPLILERYKYTSADAITADMIARVFELDRILVAKAIKNSAKERETAAYSFVHGKNALLCHVADNPGIEVPSAGYMMAWTGLNGSGSEITISDLDANLRGATRIEGELALDFKITGADLGYFLADAVA